jgi:hypothetical protein
VLAWWIGGPLAAAVLGVCLIPVRELTPAANLTFAFVALTIVVAEFGGRAAGIATAVASAVSLDFFLTRPYFHLAIEDKHDVVAFLGLGACGLIASALGAPRPTGSREGLTTGDVLGAEVRLQEMRGLAWTHLQWGLLVSLVTWVEAIWHPLPSFVAWIAVLAQGFFLALATAYATVQEQWARRGAAVGRSLRVAIDKPWSDVDDLKSALWFALGLMSIVPWAYVAFVQPAPIDVLYGAIACSAAVLLLLVFLTVMPRTRAPADANGTAARDRRGV